MAVAGAYLKMYKGDDEFIKLINYNYKHNLDDDEENDENNENFRKYEDLRENEQNIKLNEEEDDEQKDEKEWSMLLPDFISM